MHHALSYFLFAMFKSTSLSCRCCFIALTYLPSYVDTKLFLHTHIHIHIYQIYIGIYLCILTFPIGLWLAYRYYGLNSFTTNKMQNNPNETDVKRKSHT